MNQEAPKVKKVLYIITKAAGGGAQRYLRDLVRSLPKDLYHPLVAYGEGGVLLEELRVLGVGIFEIPSMRRDVFLLDDIKSFFEIYGLIRRTRPDIVHLNSSKAAALGALAARLAFTKKIVFTVHGWPFKEPRDALERWLIYFVSWLTAVLSHDVIVISSDDEKIGRSMQGIGEKIRYVPIGIEPVAYLSQEESLENLWQLVPSSSAPVEAVRVVTIAELTHNKGHKYAIEAMFDLRTHPEHYVYFIIGAGELLDELKKLVKSHHIEDRVFFLGHIAEAARYLRAFDIFVLPSLKEGMPYVLLEANESGIPTIATDVIGEELKQQYPSMRIVHKANSLVIADAVRALGKHNWSLPRQQAVQKFSLSKMVQSTVEVYAR